MRFLPICVLLLSTALLWAQLSGIKTVGGAGADYPHLTAAFGALTSQGINGNVKFHLTSAYTGEPASTTTLRIAPYSGMGTYSVTLTVDPSVTTPLIIATSPNTGVLGRFVLRLEGIDNFIIDGGPQRLLRFQNNAPSTGTGVIGLISDNGLHSTPCRNITIRNIAVDGQDKNQTRVGIYLGGLSGSGSSSLPISEANVTGNNNLLIEKCWVYGVQEGIVLWGPSTTPDQNNTIRGCKVGHPTLLLSWGGDDYSSGIVAANQANLRLEQDTVFNASSSTSYGYTGIAVGYAPQSTFTLAPCQNVRLTRNWLYGIAYTGSGGWGAYGVRVDVGGLTPANIYLYNNFIAGISADGWGQPGSIYNAYGIHCRGSSNANAGIYIYHNSIHLYGTPTTSSTNSNPSCLGIVSSIIGGVRVRNNLFQNTQSPSSPSPSRTTIAIAYGGTSASVFAELNNNAYYVSNANGAQYAFIGALGTMRYATLSAWQTALGGGREQNSLALSGAAPFSSTNDLHIPNSTTTSIEGGAVLITSPFAIEEDIDGDIRPDGSPNPDIGADEFVAVVPPCPTTINADMLNIAPATLTVGSGASFTVSVQNPSSVTQPARWFVRYDGGAWQLLGAYNPSTPSISYTPMGAGTYDFALVAYVASYHSGCQGLVNDTATVTGTTTCPAALNADQIAVSPSTVRMGGSVTVTVTNPSSVTLPARWEVSTDGGATWTVVASYAGSPFTYTPAQLGGHQIRLVAIPPAGCNALSPTFSNVVSFTVNPPLGASINDPIDITPTVPSRTDTTVNGNNSLPGYTDNYTGQGNRPSPDVYYRYILRECLDSIRVSTCNTSGGFTDTYLHVIHPATNRILYTDGGRCGTTFTLMQAALNIAHDPTATGLSQVSNPYRSTMRLRQGDTLIIVVQGYFSSSLGPFVLDVTEYRYDPTTQPNLPPPPFFTFDTSRVCFRGGIARDTLTTGITGPGLTHVWYLNGQQVAGVSGNLYVPQFTAPGVDTVVVEIRSATLSYCTPAQNLPRDTVYILVDSLPKEQFLVNGSSLYNHGEYASLSGTAPLCVTYQPSVINPAFTFTWTINGNTYTGPGPHQECYTASQTADTVVMIATNGACVEYDTLYVILDITTGLRGIENSLTVYPNPARDQVYLRVQQSGAAQVRLLDARGGLVWERTALLQAYEPFTLPVGGLPAGVYLLEVRQGQHLLRTRLAIQP